MGLISKVGEEVHIDDYVICFCRGHDGEGIFLLPELQVEPKKVLCTPVDATSQKCCLVQESH